MSYDPINDKNLLDYIFVEKYYILNKLMYLSLYLTHENRETEIKNEL